MGVSAEQVAAGQAVYTKRTLGAYDLIVLGLSNRLIWKCPSPRLVEHYNRHVSANHLDVGVERVIFSKLDEDERARSEASQASQMRTALSAKKAAWIAAIAAIVAVVIAIIGIIVTYLSWAFPVH